jgi:Uma2 family endonuclease
MPAMSVAAVNLRLSYRDFLDFPEDGRRHEIVEGEHWVTPAPNRRHQQTSMTLSFWLRGFVEQHPLGQVYAAPFDVILSEEDIVEPDLVFISRERLSILCDEGAREAPGLVVEILSDSTRRRDWQAKRRLYAHYGVVEYWLVDPEAERVTIFRPPGDVKPIADLSREAGEVLTTPLLPGFELPLARLFA